MGEIGYKIAHLSSIHPACDIRIFHKECQTLAKNAYQVTLIVPDYKEPIPYEGITVVQIPAARGVFKPAEGISKRLKVTFWPLIKAALNAKADVYHFHDPELIPVGFMLKALGKKVIYDVHEDVPKQILTKFWIKPQYRKLISKATALVEKIAGVAFDAIVVANPESAARFPIKKVFCVENFPKDEQLDLRDQFPYLQRPYNAAYVGYFTEERGIYEMVDAINLVQHPDAKLLLGGEFKRDSIEDRTRAKEGWKRVDAPGFLNRQQVAQTLASARVGLCVLQNTPNYRVIQPTKMFEYMTAGIPVIASNKANWRKIVNVEECGIWVENDSIEIAKAIDWIFSHPEEAKAMGERGKQIAIKSGLSWESEENYLLNAYRQVLGLKLVYPKEWRGWKVGKTEYDAPVKG